MSPMFHRCEDCGGERLFGQPHEAPGSCPDSADGLCPEWWCTDCGAALLATFPLPSRTCPRAGRGRQGGMRSGQSRRTLGL